MRTVPDSERDSARDETPPTVGRPNETIVRWLLLASGAAAIASIASAAILAIVHHWVPLGDHAIFAVRARDVLSTNFPLVGTWTSASIATGVNVNNPGPLFYDAIAIPTAIFGSAGAGVAVGVAIVNMLCAIGIGIVALRQGGALVGSAAFAIVTVLTWSMGSEVLIDPTQPGALLLPLLLLMMLSWGIARGDLMLLPWLVGVASFILQTYVTYVFIVGMLTVWAVVCVWLRLRSTKYEAHAVARARRAGVIALIVGAACWVQPVLQQFVGDGPGNITRLWRAARTPTSTIGFNLGVRLTADVVTMPPWWFRPSFHDFLASSRVPSTSLPVAIVSIGAVLCLLVWVARSMLRRTDDGAGFRRHDDVVGLAAATAIVAVVAGLITAVRIPVGPFGANSHVYRWLWPLAAFVTFVFVIAPVRHLRGAFRRAFVAGGFAVIAIVFAALNVPTTDQGASASTSGLPVVRDLGHQLAALRGRGPFVVDVRHTPFADPYPSAILAQLQGHGIPFAVNEEGMLYQVGFFRRFGGSNARGVLVFREGDLVDDRPPDAERVALHLGLSPVEHQEMANLEDALAGDVAAGRLTLNERGRRAKAVPPPSAPGADPRAFVRSSNFADLVRHDELALDPAREKTVTRYLELHKRWLEQTVAIYLESISQFTGNG